MIWLRKARLLIHMVRGILTCALVMPWTGAEGRRRRIRSWSRKLLRLCGIEIEVVGHGADAGSGPNPPHGALLVSNHISWLDIYVIHSWEPARFVAKSEIRSWPVIGWLCDQTGTIFIERGRKRDAHRVLHDITDVMLQGDLVCLFPEGTTTDGRHVLPFHANLMQAPISGGLPVVPLGITYLDARTGEPTTAPAYIDDVTMAQSLNAVLRSGGIRVRLSVGEPLPAASGSRRELAQAAHNRVVTLTGARAAPASTIVDIETAVA